MRAFLAIVSVIILILPIVQIFRFRGQSKYRLELSNKWIIAIVLAELILLLLAWLEYMSIAQLDSADDFFWHNMFVYWRGIFPASFLVSKFDSTLPGGLLLLFIYISALIVDYGILLFASFLKRSFMTKK